MKQLGGATPRMDTVGGTLSRPRIFEGVLAKKVRQAVYGLAILPGTFLKSSAEIRGR